MSTPSTPDIPPYLALTRRIGRYCGLGIFSAWFLPRLLQSIGARNVYECLYIVIRDESSCCHYMCGLLPGVRNPVGWTQWLAGLSKCSEGELPIDGQSNMILASALITTLTMLETKQQIRSELYPVHTPWRHSISRSTYTVAPSDSSLGKVPEFSKPDSREANLAMQIPSLEICVMRPIQ